MIRSWRLFDGYFGAVRWVSVKEDVNPVAAVAWLIIMSSKEVNNFFVKKCSTRFLISRVEKKRKTMQFSQLMNTNYFDPPCFCIALFIPKQRLLVKIMKFLHDLLLFIIFIHICTRVINNKQMLNKTVIIFINSLCFSISYAETLKIEVTARLGKERR